ncbi:SBBP repeat-containing protein [Nannocystis sp. RBIL2]|uniref:SBBP repeat-containing protein n=1 Tax=Nannocystis sp. RBIL2 TaxID=2996788 RepID=UPI0022722705|nr:SBBP repeat-containing protein [Nannocystis sp. RBIL2]MCY1070215.1 SBBP repeat-containing protein [Nannocystis sp. RBIL2]
MHLHLDSLVRAGRPASTARLFAALAALATLGVAPDAAAAPSLERNWGTYFGAPGDDFATDIALDAAGNVYVIGHTMNVGLATPGVHQSEPGGLLDAFLAKFDSTGELVWATYFGGPGLEWARGLAVGADSVAIVGITDSSTAIATPGALQPDLAVGEEGGEDGYVAVFTLDGALNWATYVGSPAVYEWASAVEIDDQGSVYAVGYLGGDAPGLGTPGAHQPAYGGAGGNGFLARFTPQGQREWGTYYGNASGGGIFSSVSLNALGELYVGGGTFAPSNAISSEGAHQKNYGGGGDDAILVRFNLDGTRAWGTFYGGTMQDLDATVAALPQGGVVLSGYTISKNNIATPGSLKPEGDGSDGFVARFDADGNRLWGTYYGHSWAQTVGKVGVDAVGSIYLCGHTNWADDYGTPNGFLPTLQGDTDAYLAKLNGDGALQWGSYYGGALYDGCNRTVVGADYRVHIVGISESTSGIATPGAHDEEYLPGGWDSFIVQFAQPIGGACASTDDCDGGPCVDGVCCDSPCGDGADDCQACSAAQGAVADGVCSLLAADFVCRPSAAACDAAELCSGDSITCPEDQQAADGEPCDEGVCDAGVCIPEDTTGNDTTGNDTTGDATTDDSSDTGEATGEPTSGELPTTGQPGTTDDPIDDTSSGSGGDATGATTGQPQEGEGGCGCRSDGGAGGLLAAPLMLLLRRRRRAKP